MVLWFPELDHLTNDVLRDIVGTTCSCDGWVWMREYNNDNEIPRFASNLGIRFPMCSLHVRIVTNYDWDTPRNALGKCLPISLMIYHEKGRIEPVFAIFVEKIIGRVNNAAFSRQNSC